MQSSTVKARANFVTENDDQQNIPAKQMLTYHLIFWLEE